MSGDNQLGDLEKRIEGKSFKRHVAEAAGLTAALIGLHSLPEQVIEDYYTHGFYKKMAEFAQPISNTDVHVSEWVVAGLGVYAACKLGLLSYRKVREAYQYLRKEKRLPKAGWFGEKSARGAARAVKFVAGVALIASLGYFLNDRRPSVVEKPVTRISDTDLRLLEREIWSYKGPMQSTRDTRTEDLYKAMDSLYVKKYGVVFPSPHKRKDTVWLLNALGRSGVSAPPLQEMAVDGQLDEVEYLSSAGHERGHLMGFSKESEASAFGFAAALDSGNPDLRRLAMLWLWRATISASPGLAQYSSFLDGAAKREIWAYREPARTAVDEFENFSFALRGENSGRDVHGSDTVGKCWALYQQKPLKFGPVQACRTR